MTDLNIISNLSRTNTEISTANLFLEDLLTKSEFKFQISFEKINLNKTEEAQQKELLILAKKLNSINYENNDTFLEHGVKTFGFGYPLLIKRDKKDKNKVIKAPLFIWQLEIEKSGNIQNKWIIKKEEDFGINVNEVLISHVNNDEDIKIETISHDFLEDNILDKQEIVELANSILNQLNAETGNNDLELKLSSCPSKEKAENLTSNTAWISWVGVFGLYRNQKQPLIKDIDLLINQFDTFQFENLKIEKFQTSTISSVATDPSQETILNSLNTNPNQIIQGPPGTGKSQSLTALITNAIENGANCLVVCEKKTALDVIYKNLKNIGLGNLCAVIDDISKDRKRIIDLVRNNMNEKYHSVSFKKDEYETLKKRYDYLKSEINQKDKKACKKILGDLTWKDVIGKAIKYKGISSLNFTSNSFTFDYQEFKNLQNIISEGQFFKNNINTVPKFLDLLNRNLFKDKYLQSTKNEIENYLNSQSNHSKTLLDDLNKLTEEIDYFSNNRKLATKFPEFWLNILPFSKDTKARFKSISNNKNDFITEYELLKTNHISYNSFEFSFIDFEKIDVTVLNTLVENLTFYLETIREINSEFDIFKEYYEWSNFYLSQPKQIQELLEALIFTKESNWTIIFENWYLNQILLKNEKEIGDLNTDDRLINELAIVNEQLKELQKNKIIHYWEGKQWNAIHNYKKTELLSLYNYRKNKQHSSRNSLRKIINIDFELFTTFFPVLLINPVVCSSIIPLKEGIFDMVIFDEASQLRLEDTYAALFRGKYKIISGDKHQMPPSNYFHTDVTLNYSDDQTDTDNEYDSTLDLAESESLLKFAEDSGYKYSYLDFHYRSRHPFLIDFSNTAFYGSRLIPMPPKQNYKPIHFTQTNGLYENSTNETEVKEVLNILFNKIEPFENGDYPSVGIATLNLYQRNLILDEIQSECINNPNSLQIFEEINKSGFFVKNLENIQGDEKDIIIISTTFGINNEGKFRQNFGPLNQEKGYRLLNVIITRAKYHLYVVTSIPQIYYSNYREDILNKGNIGKGIFYAYLSYVESIENEDENQRLGILQTISQNSNESIKMSELTFVESPFEQEVYELLIKQFKEEQINMQYKCGGFRIDFVLKTKKGNSIAIECDGASYHNTVVAYSHDIYRQKQLENLGFIFYRIWSTNFWYNSDLEMKKLAEFVNKIDNENIVKQNKYAQNCV